MLVGLGPGVGVCVGEGIGVEMCAVTVGNMKTVCSVLVAVGRVAGRVGVGASQAEMKTRTKLQTSRLIKMLLWAHAFQLDRGISFMMNYSIISWRV